MPHETSDQIELAFAENAAHAKSANLAFGGEIPRKRGRPRKTEIALLAPKATPQSGAARRAARRHELPPEGQIIPQLSSTTRYIQTQNGRLQIVGERFEVRKKVVRLGKDEMNLIEHPFALLWKQEDPFSIIHFKWTTTHPAMGKEVEASWTVTGHPEHGLPFASDERLYLVLMELTREASFESAQVHFSRYDVLQRLGWLPNARSYALLQKGLQRLSTASIHAFNSFYNPRSKNFVNGTFHLLEEFWVDEQPPGRKGANRPLPLSWFRWSRTMFESFQSGYLRSLDLDFALALSGDIALRLYRYLDKKAYGERTMFEIELGKLCVGHLGMKPTPYPSKLKERLKGAHDELLERGFLAAVAFEPMKNEPKEQKVRYTFGTQGIRSPEEIAREAQRAKERPPSSAVLLAPGESGSEAQTAPRPVEAFAGRTFEGEVVAPVPTVVPAPVAASSSESSSSPEEALLARMIGIGVSESIARELLRDFHHSGIEKQLDCLDDRKPRSRAATFVKSVRELWALPNEYVKRIEARENEQSRRLEWEQAEAEKARQKAAEREQMASAEAEAMHLDELWEKLDATTRERIQGEVMSRLGVLGRTGRAQAASDAMRRSLLREFLAKASSGATRGEV